MTAPNEAWRGLGSLVGRGSLPLVLLLGCSPGPGHRPTQPRVLPAALPTLDAGRPDRPTVALPLSLPGLDVVLPAPAALFEMRGRILTSLTLVDAAGWGARVETSTRPFLWKQGVVGGASPSSWQQGDAPPETWMDAQGVSPAFLLLREGGSSWVLPLPSLSSALDTWRLAQGHQTPPAPDQELLVEAAHHHTLGHLVEKALFPCRHEEFLGVSLALLGRAR